MRRVICLSGATVTLLLCIPLSVTAQGKGLKIGEEAVFAMGEKKMTIATPKGSKYISQTNYLYMIPIKLEAGQSITFTATMVGKDRQVWLILLDPTGKVIDGMTDYETKVAQFTAEEVSADGMYKLAVLSDHNGKFTVRATGPTGTADKESDEEKAVLEQIQQLKQQLKKLEERLDAVRKAKGKLKE